MENLCTPRLTANRVRLTNRTSIWGLYPEERTTILKIHGVVDRQNRACDSYVITEDHYIDYLAHKDIAQQLPVQLLEKMSWSHFLFLGYSLRDWNLRVILHRIWGEQKFK